MAGSEVIVYFYGKIFCYRSKIKLFMSSRTKNKKDNAEYMNGEFIVCAKSFDKVTQQ